MAGLTIAASGVWVVMGSRMAHPAEQVAGPADSPGCNDLSRQVPVLKLKPGVKLSLKSLIRDCRIRCPLRPDRPLGDPAALQLGRLGFGGIDDVAEDGVVHQKGGSSSANSS